MTDPTYYFTGTGTNIMFSLGCAKFIKEKFYKPNHSVYGLSGGCVAGISLLTTEVGQYDSLAEEMAMIFGSNKGRILPYLYNSSNYRKALNVLITEENYQEVNEKFTLAVTAIPLLDRKNISGPYPSRKDLVQLVMASGYIPGFFLRFPSSVNYPIYFDGGISKIDPFLNSVVIGLTKTPESTIWSLNPPKSLKLKSKEEHLTLYLEGYTRAQELESNIRDTLIKRGEL